MAFFEEFGEIQKDQIARVRPMKRFVIAVLIAFPALALSQNITESRIQFAAGSSGTTIEGSIKGDAIIDYMLGAQAGQRMVIAFEADNPSAYFNLLPSDDPTALHIGSVAGNGYEGTLIRSGDYRVRVYLMRNAARRGETAAYTLSVSITGNPAPTELPRSPDFADGLSGGPDWWQVANLSPDGTLNVRSGPGVDNAIIGTMKNGDTVRNLGCEMNGASRWCRIELPHDQDVVGWVAGQFLVEAASPSIPSREARGKVPCALQSSQPMGKLRFPGHAPRWWNGECLGDNVRRKRAVS